MEEQFYIFAPLLIVALLRYSKAALCIALFVIGVASLLLAQYLTTSVPMLSYYMILTRAWELLAGSLCALHLRFKGPAVANFSGALAGILGFGMIVGSAMLMTEGTPYPSFYTAIPVMGTCLIVLFAVPGTPIQRLLSWKPFVAVGLVSYSAYLWHQPVFAFARYYRLEPIPTGVMLLLSLAVLLISFASLRFVEAPFRDRSRFSRNQIFALSIVGGVVLAVTGLAGFYFNGFPHRPSLNRLAALDYEPDNRKLQHDSWDKLRALSGDKNYGVSGNRFDKTDWFDANESRPRILVVGNSHSKDMYNTLISSSEVTKRAAVARYGIQIAGIGAEFYGAPNYRKADTVVLATLFHDDDLVPLEHVVRRMIVDGKRVVILKQAHEFPFHGGAILTDSVILPGIGGNVRPQDMAKRSNELYFDDIKRGRTDDEVKVGERVDEISRLIADVKVADRLNFICPPAERACHAVDERLNKYFYDGHHYSMAGSEHFGAMIDKTGWWKIILND